MNDDPKMFVHITLIETLTSTQEGSGLDSHLVISSWTL